MKLHRLLPLLATVAALAVVTPSRAYDLDSTATVNVDVQGLGLQGHDPVAYFTDAKPMLGKPEFSAQHRGVTYRFASAEHLAAFRAQPDHFAPQFGGFCAMGAALEKKFDGDPQAWHIADGKLYINVTPATQKKWLEDVKGNIARADMNWPAIRNEAPRTLNER